MPTPTTLKRLLLTAAVGGAALAATPALASASTASTCTFSPNATPARVDVYDNSGSGALQVARSGSNIAIFENLGASSLCGGATVFNTDQVIVHGNAAADDDFIVTLLGPGKTPEADGSSELETIINNAAPTRLTVHGTEGRDIMRVTGGGGVMVGPDSDVDVRDFSATRISIAGHGGNDYLSGRGGFPASIPGPATVPVVLHGGAGDDTLTDGPRPGDELAGDDGNDTLFTFDGQVLDRNFGGAGFDTATIDDGDFHTQDIESVKVV